MTTVTRGTEIVELASGVYARLHEGLTNAGVIVGDDGVLIIDSLRVPSFARDLIQDVRLLSDKPIRYVIDTHSHWDHCWGNQEFPDSTIIGHANCRSDMLDLEDVERRRDRAASENEPWSEEVKTVQVTPPSVTFDTTMQLYFGGRRIDLLYLGRAHTSSDLFVHLPDDGLVFTGDVASNRGVPWVLDGYIQDWVQTDDRLLELAAERFVPGHGSVGEWPAVAEARDFMAALASATERAIEDGQDEATATVKVAAELRERFGGWRGLDRVEETVGYAFRQIAGS